MLPANKDELVLRFCTGVWGQGQAASPSSQVSIPSLRIEYKNVELILSVIATNQSLPSIGR